MLSINEKTEAIFMNTKTYNQGVLNDNCITLVEQY